MFCKRAFVLRSPSNHFSLVPNHFEGTYSFYNDPQITLRVLQITLRSIQIVVKQANNFAEANFCTDFPPYKVPCIGTQRRSIIQPSQSLYLRSLACKSRTLPERQCPVSPQSICVNLLLFFSIENRLLADALDVMHNANNKTCRCEKRVTKNLNHLYITIGTSTDRCVSFAVVHGL